MNRSLKLGALLLVVAGTLSAQTTVEIVASRDTTIYEGLETNGNGAGTTMISGVTSRGAIRRTLLAFEDLSEIPEGADILDATVRMELTRNQSGASRAFTLHQANASWGEAGSVPSGGAGQGGEALPGDATWLHREFDQLLWETPGGDFDASPAATAVLAAPGFYEWEGEGLSNLVAAWVNGTSENHGLFLIGDETSNRSTNVFSTREGLTPPTLVVTFGTGGTPEVFVINQGIAGGWFDPGTPGQGFLIDVDPELEFIFVAWFTFDDEDGAKVGSADQRWLTAQGFYAGDEADVGANGSIMLPITNTTGGVFDDPTPVEPGETVGTMILRFDSCSAGEISYLLDAEGLEGTIAIERLLPGTAALCEVLGEVR